MCRSIITLRRPDQPPTDEEVRAAALQFVRKISGYRKPSRRNEDAFEAAVEDIAAVSARLLEAVGGEPVVHAHGDHADHSHPHVAGAPQHA
jgi:hypothetical protein